MQDAPCNDPLVANDRQLHSESHSVTVTVTIFSDYARYDHSSQLLIIIIRLTSQRRSQFVIISSINGTSEANVVSLRKQWKQQYTFRNSSGCIKSCVLTATMKYPILVAVCLFYTMIAGIEGDYGIHSSRGELTDLPGPTWGDVSQPYYFQTRITRIKVPFITRCSSFRYPDDIVSCWFSNQMTHTLYYMSIYRCCLSAIRRKKQNAWRAAVARPFACESSESQRNWLFRTWSLDRRRFFERTIHQSENVQRIGVPTRLGRLFLCQKLNAINWT